MRHCLATALPLRAAGPESLRASTPPDLWRHTAHLSENVRHGLSDPEPRVFCAESGIPTNSLCSVQQVQAAGPRASTHGEYQVGHHGSHNGTTVDLLEAMTPEIAVISVGEWDFGSPNQPFSTHAYGHPRRSIVDMLILAVRWLRPQPTTVMVAERPRTFSQREVRSAIFATSWDGTVMIEASENRSYALLP